MERTGGERAAPAWRLPVIANETWDGLDPVEAIRGRSDGDDAEVVIVAPALTSRLRHRTPAATP